MSRITMCVYCWQCQLDAKLKVLHCPRMEHQSFSATLIDDTMINKSWNGKSRKKSFSATQWWMAWWSIREWSWMKHQHRSEVISINLFCLQTLKITFLLCNHYLYFLLVRLLFKIQNHLQPIQKFWHKNNSLYLWIEGIVGKLWEHIFLFSFELSLTLRYLWKVFHKYDRETRSSSLNLLLQRWINLQKFPAKISSLILALQ